MKHLYEPNMFNYTWESIDHDQYIVGTYYLEDIIDDDDDFADHFDQVQRLALEGSTSSWQEVASETPEIREKLTSKVLGYYEIPAPKGTKKAIIQLGFAVGVFSLPFVFRHATVEPDPAHRVDRRTNDHEVEVPDEDG